MTQTDHDVIIIGAGSAGLSAGLVLARAQAKVLLIDSGAPRNAPAEAMHGFVSRDGIAPAEFLAAGRQEVSRYGGSILRGAVDSVATRDDGSFAVTVAGGRVEIARALLVATGLTDELPHIPGLDDWWGTRVHHCPYCHGYEVLNQTIVVIGGSQKDMSLKQAALLRRYSEHVSLVTNGMEITTTERSRLAAFGIHVIDGSVSRIVGPTGSLDAVVLTDGTSISCDAVFIAPRQHPNDGVLRSLGCEVDPATGFVAANGFGQTSVAGVWAAGNVVTPTAQVITAAGAASASAIAINGWLLNKDLDAASAARS